LNKRQSNTVASSTSSSIKDNSTTAALVARTSNTDYKQTQYKRPLSTEAEARASTEAEAEARASTNKNKRASHRPQEEREGVFVALFLKAVIPRLCCSKDKQVHSADFDC
jgi:hypothetical protein